MSEVYVPMTGEDWRIAMQLQIGRRGAVYSHTKDGAIMTVIARRPLDEHTQWVKATFGMSLDEVSEVRRG